MNHKKSQSGFFWVLTDFLFLFIFVSFFMTFELKGKEQGEQQGAKSLENQELHSYRQKENKKNTSSFFQRKKPPEDLPEAQSYLEFVPQKILKNEIVRFKPVPGYEINLQAPNNCGEGKLLQKSKSYMECQFVKPQAYEVQTYICDREKTRCFIESRSFVVVRSEKAGFLSFFSSFFKKKHSISKKP